MGQNQPLELSEEENKELSSGLFREWWVTATWALDNTIGDDESLRMEPREKGCRLEGKRAAKGIAASE